MRIRDLFSKIKANLTFGKKEIKKSIGWKSDIPSKEVIYFFGKGYIRPGDRVIDIGCGFGRNSNWLAKQGVKVTAINIDKDEIKNAESKESQMGVSVEYVKANVTDIPFSRNLFDIALDLGCTHMCSKKDQELAVEEIARILKPRGYLLYFGFSKEHPAYINKPDSPQFRDLDDIKKLYCKYFDIIKVEKIEWKPKTEERVNFNKHKGLNIIMKRKNLSIK